MCDNWLSAELIAKAPECSRMLLFSPFCSESWQGGRRRRRKAKFNVLLTQKPLFAMAGGVRCVLSVYLAWQLGGGKSGGAAGGRGCYTMQGTPVYGEGGVAEKQPVPSGRGVGDIIRTHFPIPRHLTALCLTSSLLAKLPPVSHPYPHTACRGPRRGCRKRGRWGLWKLRGEIITGNSPGYGGIYRGPVFARMAWATNLCE